jgi:hypothetical protein
MGFKVMAASALGYRCARCGHMKIEGNPDFDCECNNCAKLGRPQTSSKDLPLNRYFSRSFLSSYEPVPKAKSKSNNLNNAGADAAEEIFGVGFCLGQDFGLVAILEGHFLQEEFDGVFGFEALGDEFADAGSEAVGVVG